MPRVWVGSGRGRKRSSGGDLAVVVQGGHVRGGTARVPAFRVGGTDRPALSTGSRPARSIAAFARTSSEVNSSSAPAPVYSGSTSWRAVTTSSSAAVTEMSLSWGQGTEFGVMPLGDGRTYWYAAANAGEAQRNPDELEELRRRFGTWPRTSRCPACSSVAWLSSASGPALRPQDRRCQLGCPTALAKSSSNVPVVCGSSSIGVCPMPGSGSTRAPGTA